MLISSYPKDWLTHLHKLALNAADSNAGIYLLIDGVFVPGLHRKLHQLSPTLLFESLPGCNDETRDVSPFLIPYEMTTPHLAKRLTQCSGWPMISVIETSESQAELAERLAAWCIVEVGGQRFNFRFPDTRRLPTIFSVLTQEQKNQMSGPAKRWSYIARDGTWHELPVQSVVSVIADRPTVLNEQQFGELVADSEIDEMLTMLLDRGYVIEADPYLHYSIVSQALRVAQYSTLDVGAKLDWCESCVGDGELMAAEQMEARFVSWCAVSV